METKQIIDQFTDRHAPTGRTNEVARHTLATLSRYLNAAPDEVIALSEAGLLQAAEAWPGSPSLRFSMLHLSTLRRELARQHAEDTVELCAGKSPRQIQQVLDASWEKRSRKVVELSRKL